MEFETVVEVPGDAANIWNLSSQNNRDLIGNECGLLVMITRLLLEVFCCLLNVVWSESPFV